MTTRIITLSYRKVIDASAVKSWEKMVWEDSYTELRMQAQLYNPEKKYRTFAELLREVPGAEQLHFLVSAAVIGYIQQLNEVVPDILNNLGKHFLRFNRFQFEIINSDLQDKSKHQVAIHFYAESLVWHYTIANFLLVSDKPAPETGEWETNLLQLQPYLNIHTLQNLP